MNELGISSAYTASATSVYSSNQVNPIKDRQELSVAEKKLADSSYPGEINDEAIISDEAQKLLAKENGDSKSKDAESSSNLPKSTQELTPDQEQVVAKLKARDAEVRAHEQAHIAAAAGISASAPTYDYQTGPDGKKYAVGGEVTVSFVQGKDPAENIANAEAMEAAALAPAQPSSQDMAVAKSAEKIIAEAKQQLAEQQQAATDTGNKTDETGKIQGTATKNNIDSSALTIS